MDASPEIDHADANDHGNQLPQKAICFPAAGNAPRADTRWLNQKPPLPQKSFPADILQSGKSETVDRRYVYR